MNIFCDQTAKIHFPNGFTFDMKKEVLLRPGLEGLESVQTVWLLLGVLTLEYSAEVSCAYKMEISM